MVRAYIPFQYVPSQLHQRLFIDMTISGLTFVLANSVNPSSVRPYLTIPLASLEGSPSNSLRARIFFDRTKRVLIVLHNSDQISIFDLESGKYILGLNMGIPFGYRVEFHPPFIVNYPGQGNSSYAQIIDIKTTSMRKLDYVGFKLDQPFPLTPSIKNPIPHSLQMSCPAFYMLSDSTAISFDRVGKIRHPQDHTLSLRTAPDFSQKKIVKIPHRYLFDSYITPDKKLLGFHEGGQGKSFFYRTSNLKFAGSIRHSTGELAFDPHSKWAINHGRQRWHHKGSGGIPVLVNLDSFEHYNLEPLHNPSGPMEDYIEDAAIDSKLGIAATIYDRTIHLYRLPK